MAKKKIPKYDKDAVYKVGDKLEFSKYGVGEVIEVGITNDPEKLEKVEGIDLEKMLEIINKRIEYLYDKDHTIGHSYFMEVKTIQELKELFLKKIIPLLEEYFYDDYEKIKLVFNDNGFIKKDDSYKTLFSKFSNGYEEDKTIYKIDKDSLDYVENYIKIYNGNN
jgi:5-methylcytosine-specific restriction protein B